MVKVNDTVLDKNDCLYTVRRVMRDDIGMVILAQGIGRNVFNVRLLKTDEFEVVEKPYYVIMQEMARLVLTSLYETYFSVEDTQAKYEIADVFNDVKTLFKENYNVITKYELYLN